jgi:peroxiredoxin
LAELRSLLRTGEQVVLWGISMDTAERSRELVEKIAADGRGKIAFPLLSDPQHRVIDAYGLQDPRYLKQRVEGIPYPAAYVIDKTGRVAWSRIDMDYRERPPTAELRAALDALR